MSQQQRQGGQQLRMLQKLNQLSTKHQSTEQPTGETIARPSIHQLKNQTEMDHMTLKQVKVKVIVVVK